MVLISVLFFFLSFTTRLLMEGVLLLLHHLSYINIRAV